MWSRVGFEENAPYYHERQSVITKEVAAGTPKLEILRRYYSKVPRSLLLAVYRAYQLDFELFDYDINEFLDQVGHEPFIFNSN